MGTSGCGRETDLERGGGGFSAELIGSGGLLGHRRCTWCWRSTTGLDAHGLVTLLLLVLSTSPNGDGWVVVLAVPTEGINPVTIALGLVFGLLDLVGGGMAREVEEQAVVSGVKDERS